MGSLGRPQGSRLVRERLGPLLATDCWPFVPMLIWINYPLITPLYESGRNENANACIHVPLPEHRLSRSRLYAQRDRRGTPKPSRRCYVPCASSCTGSIRRPARLRPNKKTARRSAPSAESNPLFGRLRGLRLLWNREPGRRVSCWGDEDLDPSLDLPASGVPAWHFSSPRRGLSPSSAA